ncbi:scavenger receptor class F member 2-like, partial [Protobothrops mucrosquamatus]|uniref:scavenger receptor class F member 2-like n=1 Tax=Protobothrops mucrosquamatus TaxID=103944 RepID=UPI0010FB3E40
AHHDLENTLNCSFIEPPSVVDQPSPSWSSRGSFSSFDTTDEGPVYCVPHEESASDPKERVSAPSSTLEKAPQPLRKGPATETEEAGEYTVLKENPPGPADSGEAPLLKSSDSERSSCGSGSVSGALYARIARLSRQSREEEEAPVAEPRPAKPPSPERAKPPPPDPSTKPKVSWIHHKYNAAQSNTLPAPGAAELQAERRPGPSKRKRSPGEVARAKERAPRPPQEPGSPEGPPGPAQARQRSRTGPEPAENLNGALHSALKRMGGAGVERRPAEAPRSPAQPKAPPGFSAEAATLLAAQLKEKTQSLQRGEAGARPNGMSPLPAQREKPAPPQKARQAGTAPGQKAGKPLLPTSAPLQKLLGPGDPPAAEPKSGEKPGGSGGGSPEAIPAPGDPAVKKTPIKKPPRKKGREGLAEPPKAAAPPPQTVQ